MDEPNYQFIEDKDQNKPLITQQFIIRNNGNKGYETVYSSTGSPISEEYLPFILPKFPIGYGEGYFYKQPIDESKTLVKLVVGDGFDDYGRNKSKIILLIIPNLLYERNGCLLYYANPILKKSIKLDNNKPLGEEDFGKGVIGKILLENLDEKLNALLIQYMFMHKHVVIIVKDSKEKKEMIERLQKTLAFIDYCIPSFFRNKLSFMSSISKNQTKLANCTILALSEDDEFDIDDGTVVIEYSKSFNEIFIDYNPIKIFFNLSLSNSIKERAHLEKIIRDIRKVQAENIIPTEMYKKILDRFEMSILRTI